MERRAADPFPILYLSRGGDMDGAQRQLLHLVAGLDRTRFYPVVLLDAPGTLLRELHARGITAQDLPFHHWRRFPDALLRYLDVSRAAEVARVSAIRLVHASDLWKSPYASRIAARLGVPWVVHMRGPLSARDIHKHGIPQASAVIAIARRYVNDLEKAGVSRERISEIDDAADLGRLAAGACRREEFRQAWGVSEEQVVVGCVGRIEATKRTLEFLEAAARVPGEIRRRAVFVLVGDVPQESYLQELQGCIDRHGLRECVRFMGRTEDMPGVLAGLDVLATFCGGSVMFEAMAAGKAVFSARTDAHSIHTIHGQTAWCTSTLEPVEAGAALGELIGDAALRTRLGAAGTQHVRRHLSPATLVEKTERLYGALLGGVAPAVEADLTARRASAG